MSVYSQNALRQIHRFGNLTALTTSELLVSSRAYVEQGSQAQRSVKSTSSQDNPAGTGAKVVRIVYLDSNYVQHTEDVTLNGVTGVNTVGTDIRFIEEFFVIQGAAAVGALQLMTTTGGGGSEFCGIPSVTTQAFLCHHYVPAGKMAYLLDWGASTNDEANFKLLGQAIYNGNRVDNVQDLFNLTAGNPTPPTNIRFDRLMPTPLPIGEKCYIRATVVPIQATSTIIRAYFDLWEE